MEACPWIRYAPLTIAEAAEIAKEPSIRGVVAHVNTSSSVKYKDRALPGAQVEAYTPGWTDVTGGDISPGRSFTESENADGAQVTLIDDDLKQRLFSEAEAVGKTISVDGKPFLVIGALSPDAELLRRCRCPRQADHPIRDGAAASGCGRPVARSHRETPRRRGAGRSDG